VFDLPRRGDPSGPVSFSHMALRAAGLPVRCGVFDPSGYRIACCSEYVFPLLPTLVTRFGPSLSHGSLRPLDFPCSDLSIKILSSSSTSYRVPISLPLSHSTHSQPPRSLAWSPDGLVLLSTGCDGRLVVWDTSKSLIKHKKNANGEEEEEEEGPDDWEMPDVVRKLDGIVADSQPEYACLCSRLPGDLSTDL
jgi:WD40 repeat protein